MIYDATTPSGGQLAQLSACARGGTLGAPVCGWSHCKAYTRASDGVKTGRTPSMIVGSSIINGSVLVQQFIYELTATDGLSMSLHLDAVLAIMAKTASSLALSDLDEDYVIERAISRGTFQSSTLHTCAPI